MAAIAAIKKDEDKVKAVDAFNKLTTLTIELHTSGLNVTKDDFTIDMDWIHGTDDGLLSMDSRKVIKLVFTDKFKKTDVALVLTDANGKYPVYDVTLPAIEKDFDLDVNLPNSAAIMQSAKGETTNINLLTTYASYKTYAWNTNYGDGHTVDGEWHDYNVKGLTLGEGIVVDAISAQTGDVVVDGATINYYAIHPDKPSITSFSDPKGFSGNYERRYYSDNTHIYQANGTTAYYLRNAKVFASKADPANVIADGLSFSNASMDKLFIASDAEVHIYDADVAEIEGEANDKSKVFFHRGTYNSTNPYAWGAKSVKKVTISNSYQGWGSDYDEETETWVSVIKTFTDNDLYLNSNGVPADVLEDCIIQPTYVYVYPEAGLTKNTFKPASKTATQWIQVIPPVQTSETPDYTYTFTDVNFNAAGTTLYVSDNSGYFAGALPIIDDETGEQAYRLAYHFAYYDKDRNRWMWKIVYSKSEVSEEALTLDPNGSGRYWYVEKEYYYYSNSVVNPNKIKDYTVAIALNGCKVNSTPVDRKSGIFETYNRQIFNNYDINEKFDIDGVRYTPERVDRSESESGIGTSPYSIWLTKD